MSLWLSKQTGQHEHHQQDANQRCIWQASCKYLRVLHPPLACIQNLKTLIYRLGFMFVSIQQTNPSQSGTFGWKTNSCSLCCAPCVGDECHLPPLLGASFLGDWTLGINTHASEMDYVDNT